MKTTQNRHARRRNRREQGAALAEYGLLLAGLALSAMVAVSVLGGKVGGLIASVATLLPGSTASQSAVVQVGSLLPTNAADINGDGVLEQVIDAQRVEQNVMRPTGQLGPALGLPAHQAGHLYQLGDESIH